MKVYQLDVINRLDYIKASITCQFGAILKMDSTKKITNKLAGISYFSLLATIYVILFYFAQLKNLFPSIIYMNYYEFFRSWQKDGNVGDKCRE